MFSRFVMVTANLDLVVQEMKTVIEIKKNELHFLRVNSHMCFILDYNHKKKLYFFKNTVIYFYFVNYLLGGKTVATQPPTDFPAYRNKID